MAMQPGTAVHYWRGSAEIREDIAAAVQQMHREFVVVRTLEEVLDLNAKGSVTLLIVDGSAGEREASGRILEISHTDPLRRVPVVFVSAQSDGRVAPLRRNFPRLYPLNIPYRTPSLIGIFGRLLESDDCSLDEFLGVRGEPSGVVQAVSTETVPSVPTVPPPAASPTAPPSVANGAARVSARRLVDGNSAENRQRLVAHRNPAALDGTYGGQVFSIATELDDFSDDHLFPSTKAGSALKSELTDIMQIDRWAAIQGRRAMFAAIAIGRQLGLSEKETVSLATAAASLNHSFAGPGPGRLLRRYDLIGQTEEEFVEMIFATFQAGVQWMEHDLREPDAAAIAHGATEVLRHQALPRKPGSALRMMQCLAGIELSIRAAWGAGYWNPYGAYRMICFLRRPGSSIDDTEVRLALSRILGEAASTHVTVANFLQSDVEAGDILGSLVLESKKAGALRPFIPPRHARTVKIQLADLMPGMRIAQPVRAVDGKTVLDSAVLLNNDMVMQLWQLSAVRALERVVSVYLEQ